MEVTEFSSLPAGTQLFGHYAILRAPTFPQANGAPWAYSRWFTTPEEFFAAYPDNATCTMCLWNGETLVHGVETWRRSKPGFDLDCVEGGLLPPMPERVAQLNAQRQAAEADGSMAAARAKCEQTKRAEALPAIVPRVQKGQVGFIPSAAADVLEISDERYRKRPRLKSAEKPGASALTLARRRAVEFGWNAVIQHNPDRTRSGNVWSPCRVTFSVVTWATPRGEKISICAACEQSFRAHGTWPKQPSTGEEYCQVSWGLHAGACDICSAGDWSDVTVTLATDPVAWSLTEDAEILAARDRMNDLLTARFPNICVEYVRGEMPGRMVIADDETREMVVRNWIEEKWMSAVLPS